MITDNYTMLFVLVITVVALGVCIWYFISQLNKALKNYRESKREQDEVRKQSILKLQVSTKNISTNDGDNETYNDEEKIDMNEDRLQYMENPKRSFIQEFEKTYADYNRSKGEYMKTSLNVENNDDVIDRTALYSEYDDYTY
jgi:uncharacterized protein HemX